MLAAVYLTLKVLFFPATNAWIPVCRWEQGKNTKCKYRFLVPESNIVYNLQHVVSVFLLQACKYFVLFEFDKKECFAYTVELVSAMECKSFFLPHKAPVSVQPEQNT